MNTETNDTTAPQDGATVTTNGTPETAAPNTETEATAQEAVAPEETATAADETIPQAASGPDAPAAPEAEDEAAAPAPAPAEKPKAKRDGAAKATGDEAKAKAKGGDKPAATEKPADESERIAKVLARAGLCSRREAEEWIAAGRVAVNGKTLDSPAFTVGPRDRIAVDGNPLPMKERTRLWLFHKPRGLVTTTHDPEGRPTVFSVLPEDMPRVITIGRLDINTEGLLLLTNDGGLARVLELPSTGWLRRYRVRAYGEVDQRDLDELKHGVSLDGIDYGSIEAEIERVQGSNTWLVLGLREGKNREVKRVLGSLGLTVNRLIRVSFGPFQLADLEEGEIREIRGRVLRDQLGKRLVSESGADFDAPIVHHIPGTGEEEEAPKRRIKSFDPDDRSGAGRGAKGGPRPVGKGGHPGRTKMEFIGTGERLTRDRDERRPPRDADGRGGRFKPNAGPGEARGFRDRQGEGFGGDKRSGGGYRSEGFKGRGGEGAPRSEGFRGRPQGDDRPRSGGFRDRPQGDAPRGENRSEGYRGRPQGDDRPRSGGFRDRPQGDAPRGENRSEGYRGRPQGDDRPKSGGFRDRPQGGAPRGENRSEGYRGRPQGDDRPRSGGFRDRPQGDAPRGENRSEGYRGRPQGDDRPRSGGFRDRPQGDAPCGENRSEGYRGRPQGDAPRGENRSEGFRGRPDGEAPRSGGFKPRPEGSSFGPRGPRGMNPGGRTGPKGAGGPGGKSGGPGGARGPGGGKGGPGGRGPGGGKGGRSGPRGGKE